MHVKMIMLLTGFQMSRNYSVKLLNLALHVHKVISLISRLKFEFSFENTILFISGRIFNLRKSILNENIP